MPCLKPLGNRVVVSCSRELPDTVVLTGGKDEDLAHLVCQKEIVSLLFAGGRFTNAGLGRLLELPALEELFFDRSELHDAEMPALARLPRLRSLELLETLISDAGVEHLHAAPELVSLSCLLGESTDEGLERWKASRMRRFRKKPPENQVREAAYVLGNLSHGRIRPGRQLTRLSLSQSPTTDLDLEYIACFPELQEIDLFQTNVTEAGLRHLSGLKHLRKLEVGEYRHSKPRSSGRARGAEGTFRHRRPRLRRADR
jgi:hypothetical protein